MMARGRKNSSICAPRPKLLEVLEYYPMKIAIFISIGLVKTRKIHADGGGEI
jgi:hypothetical protein